MCTSCTREEKKRGMLSEVIFVCFWVGIHSARIQNIASNRLKNVENRDFTYSSNSHHRTCSQIMRIFFFIFFFFSKNFSISLKMCFLLGYLHLHMDPAAACDINIHISQEMECLMTDPFCKTFFFRFFVYVRSVH